MAPLHDSRRPWWQTPLFAAGLAMAVWLIYRGAFHYPFVFDDIDTIQNGGSIRTLWPLSVPLQPPPDTSTAGRPLVNFSFALNYFFGGLDPAGYRVVNCAIHFINALLLLGIIRRTLLLDRFAGRFERHASALAFSIALIWAAHPLQTEAVAYVVQRTELMVACCYFATLYFAIRYFQASFHLVKTAWLIAAALACACGMGCKEVMVSVPVIVLLYDCIFINRSPLHALKKSGPLYVALAAGWSVLIYLNINAPRSASAGFGIGTPAADWWLTQTKVFMTYLRLVVWPWPLIVHREMPFLKTIGDAWPWAAATALLVGIVFVIAWQRRAGGFAGLFALAILAPTSLVPLFEVAAERRMYMPLAGAIAVGVVGLWTIAQRLFKFNNAAAFIVATAVAISSLLGVVAARRLDAYRSSIALWSDVIAHEPDNATAHSYLGVALVEAGRGDEGILHARRAVELSPGHFVAENNLGTALLNTGRPAEAIDPLSRAAAMRPNFAEAQLNLGAALATLGRREEAIPHFQNAITLNPFLFEAHENLGKALAAQGRPAQAVAEYRAAIHLRPDLVKSHVALGTLLMDVESPDAAIREFHEALRYDPKNVDAMMNTAVAQALAGRRNEAIAWADRALEQSRADGNASVAARIQGWLANYQTAH